MIKIIFNGASGRMGQALVPLLQQNPEIDIVAATSRRDNLNTAINATKPDCVIDFTVPDAAYNNALTIIQNGVHPIIGTSGLKQNEINALSQECTARQLGGLIVPNFSISAILMQDFASKAAKWFSDVRIIERHHKQKLDAPSGTAIASANKITDANRVLQKQEHEYGIEIESQRLDNIFAEQEIIFHNKTESLSIEQKANSRDCMLDGVVLACKKVSTLEKLEIGLAQFLFA